MFLIKNHVTKTENQLSVSEIKLGNELSTFLKTLNDNNKTEKEQLLEMKKDDVDLGGRELEEEHKHKYTNNRIFSFFMSERIIQTTQNFKSTWGLTTEIEITIISESSV